MKAIFRILWPALLVSLSARGAQFNQPDRPYAFEFDEAKWELVAGAERPATQDVDKAMEGRTLTTLQRRQADEKYRARFSVVVEDPTKVAGKGDGALAAYASHAIEFMKSQRFHILSSGPKAFGKLGAPAFEIVANQRDFGLTFRQVVFLWETKGKREAYLVTATTRTNKFDEYKKELDGLFDTFTMKK